MEEINAAGGWTDARGKKHQLEMLVGDMANDPKQAITLFRQYATDSQVIGVARPDQLGRLRSAGAGRRTDQAAADRQWLGRADQGVEYLRLPGQSGLIVAVPVLVQKVVAKLKIKKLAVIYDQTQDAQAGDAEVCKELAGKLGYEVVAFEAFRAERPGFLAADRQDPQPAAGCHLRRRRDRATASRWSRRFARPASTSR